MRAKIGTVGLALVLLLGLALRVDGEDGSGAESLKKLYERALDEAEGADLSAQVDLEHHYRKRLDVLRAEQLDAGNLDGVQAIDHERKVLKSTGEPPALPPTTPASLVAARKIYESARATNEARNASRVRAIKTTYIEKLEELVVEKTRAEDLAGALAIRKQVEAFKESMGVAFSYVSGGGLNDAAVIKALDWLVEQQNEDGSWGRGHPVAMTGFALLAFSGHHETVDSPVYGKALVKAINYLVEYGRNNDGKLGPNGQHLSYEHGIATYALAEVYSINKDTKAKFEPINRTLANAMPLIIEGQTKGGGWLYAYGHGGTGDLSVSGWNIQALKAAKLTGRKFTGLDKAMNNARQYLDLASTHNGLFKYRIRDNNKGKLSLTGVGVLSARLLGEKMANEDTSFKAILAKKPRGYRGLDLYALYYHSQACYLKGGRVWRDYNDFYHKLVFDSQEADGSWPVAGGHSAGGDEKIYHTCLCTLMMEVEYRAGRWGGK